MKQNSWGGDFILSWAIAVVGLPGLCFILGTHGGVLPDVMGALTAALLCVAPFSALFIMVMLHGDIF